MYVCCSGRGACVSTMQPDRKGRNKTEEAVDVHNGSETSYVLYVLCTGVSVLDVQVCGQATTTVCQCVCLSRFSLSLTPFFPHPSSAFTGAHRFFPSKREGEYVSKIAPSGDFLIYEFFLGDFPYLSSSPHCLVARKPIMTESRERLHVVHGGVWLT